MNRGIQTQTKETVNTENISGMFIVLWPITRQPLQPQKMNGFSVTEWIWSSICLEKTQD